MRAQLYEALVSLRPYLPRECRDLYGRAPTADEIGAAIRRYKNFVPERRAMLEQRAEEWRVQDRASQPFGAANGNANTTRDAMFPSNDPARDAWQRMRGNRLDAGQLQPMVDAALARLERRP